MKSALLSTIALLATLYPAAQSLSKEIVIDKEIILEQRDVTPLPLRPRLVVDSLKPVPLSWSPSAVATDPTVEISTLPPAPWRLAIEESPWRGYLRAGYFPALQADIAAGYRLIARNYMRLNLWGQYTGLSYRNHVGDDRFRLSTNDLTIGAAYRWNPVNNATLSAAIDYLASAYTMPRYLDNTDAIKNHSFNQAVSDISIRLGWDQQLDRVDYGAHLALNHFEFAHATFYKAEHLRDRYKAMYQTAFSAHAWASSKITGNFAARLDLNFDNVSSPEGYLYLSDRPTRIKATDYGVFKITPSVITTAHNFRLKIGLNAYVRTGQVSQFKIYPDIKIDWQPCRLIALYATVAGGTVDLNTFSALFARSHYLNPSVNLSPAVEKMSYAAGLSIGSIKGLSLDLNATAASWSDVVMPLAGNLMTIGDISQSHMRSILGQATLRYTYADLFNLTISYAATPGGHDNGCRLWNDRAKGVLNSRLQFTAHRWNAAIGYSLRHRRHAYTLDGDRLSLSIARDLNIGGAYSISDRLSIEVEAHNLTASRYMTTWGVTNPGITGFIGATYKF